MQRKKEMQEMEDYCSSFFLDSDLIAHQRLPSSYDSGCCLL